MAGESSTEWRFLARKITDKWFRISRNMGELFTVNMLLYLLSWSSHHLEFLCYPWPLGRPLYGSVYCIYIYIWDYVHCIIMYYIYIYIIYPQSCWWYGSWTFTGETVSVTQAQEIPSSPPSPEVPADVAPATVVPRRNCGPWQYCNVRSWICYAHTHVYIYI